MTTPQQPQPNSPWAALTREVKELTRVIKEQVSNVRQAKMAGGVNTGQAQGGGAPTGLPGTGGGATPPGAPQGALGGAWSSVKALPWGKALIAAEVASLALIIPSLMGGSKEAKGGVEELNTSLGGLNKSAMDASSAIARLVIELRAVTAEAGISSRQLVGLTAAYSAIGSENPLEDASGFARHFGQLRRGFALGQPNQGYLLGAGLLGMDPLAVNQMDPLAYQMKVVERLRGMGEDTRKSEFTRGALELMYGSEGMADIELMAGLSDEHWQRLRQSQERIDRNMGDYMPGLARRSQAIRAIGAQRGMEQFEFRMQREFMRTGGGGEPILPQIRAQIGREWEDAQRVFWKSMMPVLEQVRKLFSELGKPGGAIELFGKVMEGAAAGLADMIGSIIGGFILLAAAIKLLVDVIRGILKFAGAVGKALQGDFGGAWGDLKSIGGMFASTGRMAGIGWDTLSAAQIGGSYADPNKEPTMEDIIRQTQGIPEPAALEEDINEGFSWKGLALQGAGMAFTLQQYGPLAAFFTLGLLDQYDQGRQEPATVTPGGVPAP